MFIHTHTHSYLHSLSNWKRLNKTVIQNTFGIKIQTRWCLRFFQQYGTILLTVLKVIPRLLSRYLVDTWNSILSYCRYIVSFQSSTHPPTHPTHPPTPPASAAGTNLIWPVTYRSVVSGNVKKITWNESPDFMFRMRNFTAYRTYVYICIHPARTPFHVDGNIKICAVYFSDTSNDRF